MCFIHFSPVPLEVGIIPPSIFKFIFMENANQENKVFKTLVAINGNEHTERKGNLNYLS